MGESASIDSGDERLEADFPEPAKASPEVVEHVYRRYPDGEVSHYERRSDQVENQGMEPMLPVIRYTDVVSVWLKILRRPLG